MMNKRMGKIGRERAFEVIRAPVVTEKSTMGNQYGHVVLRVSMDATKPEIKQAVEMLFEVKVEGVNTSVLKGKRKRFRGKWGRQSDMKKAVIRLAEGHTIDVGRGL
jgi:large subunit ribosomal protein L23